ncbi:tyrosine-type recombinase/integrase [Natrinema sp. 1APR25-10V2]|uniref:tyrosine-type recombinase/integrase n=1 Tax=Natrinema sp. 1APR25-10V2 TaxID=2951081 RepID=UPI00287598E7|nr:tyrosine-type recombinase/integrase [Natrinema sp. 1APR25-10V2]MDS0475282.1 tyrosine-type recombinase/integrase [Natrinema sp. 1APR25-10V2]
MSDGLQPLSPEEGVDRFLRHHRPGVRETSFRNAKHRLSVFLEWCDERDIGNLNDLDGRELADFVDWRRVDVAPITLQKQLSSVRQALRWWADIEAVDEGLAEKLHSPDLPDGAQSKDVFLEPRRAKAALEYFDRHHYGSRDHALIALLWRTGMRRSAAQSIDVDDLEPDDHAVRVEHRPENGTTLKNGDDGNRWVYLGPKWFAVLTAYRDNPDRPRVTDDHGRQPLFTTQQGTRPTGDTIYKWVVRALHPCTYGECPHDETPRSCDARGSDGHPAQCPSARSPHAIRRGAITHHLNQETTPEVVSERMDVSLEILYEHYDARTEREKMEVRRENLP